MKWKSVKEGKMSINITVTDFKKQTVFGLHCVVLSYINKKKTKLSNIFNKD